MKQLGEENSNHQVLLRLTDAPGTDHNARVWILECGHCGFVYGCNGTDAWQRKCPACQGGTPGFEIPTERDGTLWSREEHLIALNLYNQIPFGKMHMKTPEVIKLAAILGRKVGSVSLKLANFSRLDPALRGRNIQGMAHGARGEEEVWNEFQLDPEKVAYESAAALSARIGTSLEAELEPEADLSSLTVTERQALTKVRVNQRFFRNRVLSAYDYRCCVTGIRVKKLLVASHIVPWAEDKQNRLNPRNGLCLNAMHDRMFDTGLMWIDEAFTVRYAKAVLKTESQETLGWLSCFNGRKLAIAGNFTPDPALLAIHAARCEK